MHSSLSCLTGHRWNQNPTWVCSRWSQKPKEIIQLNLKRYYLKRKKIQFLFHLFYVFVYLDINRGKPCLVNLMLSKLFLTGSFYVCSANFILIRFNLIFFRKCLTSINPNIMSFNFKSSKCHALKILLTDKSKWTIAFLSPFVCTT